MQSNYQREYYQRHRTEIREKQRIRHTLHLPKKVIPENYVKCPNCHTYRSPDEFVVGRKSCDTCINNSKIFKKNNPNYFKEYRQKHLAQMRESEPIKRKIWLSTLSKERLIAYHKQRTDCGKKYRDRLADRYVANKIRNMPKDKITSELIDLKRQLIIAKRLIGLTPIKRKEKQDGPNHTDVQGE